jgi:hypothetical protein
MSGKGSRPRPISDRSSYESNFDAIFKKVFKEEKVKRFKEPDGSPKKHKDNNDS